MSYNVWPICCRKFITPHKRFNIFSMIKFVLDCSKLTNWVFFYVIFQEKFTFSISKKLIIFVKNIFVQIFIRIISKEMLNNSLYLLMKIWCIKSLSVKFFWDRNYYYIYSIFPPKPPRMSGKYFKFALHVILDAEKFQQTYVLFFAKPFFLYNT